MKTWRMRSNRLRKEHDAYPTPYSLARSALERLFFDIIEASRCSRVLDAGAGSGIWGQALFDLAYESDAVRFPVITGIELRSLPKPPGYHEWIIGDFLSVDALGKYDLIVGSPPYSLMEEFVRRAFQVVSPSGFIFFLGRLGFLTSKKRYLDPFRDFHIRKVYVLSRRPCFYTVKAGRRSTDADDYTMYLWQNGFNGSPELGWIYWEYRDGRDDIKEL